jgi:23S rRNA (adenine-N6)-dimethyltransferase
MRRTHECTLQSVGHAYVGRRQTPLLSDDHRPYQRWVQRVFNGRGRGMADILARSGVPASAARRWCADQHLTCWTLPKDLKAEQWVAAYWLVTRRP